MTDRAILFTMTLMTFTMVILVWESDGSQVIMNPPKPTVGCLGGMSIFTCSSNRSDVLGIEWTINGNDLDDKTKEERGIFIDTVISNDFANSTLTIAGLPINHGIKVGCVVVVSSPKLTIEAKSATFNVSEIPEVQDLQMPDYIDSDNRVTVTWNRPSCLPVSYTYLISVDNGTDLNHATTTSEQFSVNVAPCYNYTFHVTVVVVDANHPQFNSSVSTVEKMVTTPERDLSLDVDGYTPFIKFHNQTNVFLDVTFKISNTTCQTQPVILFQHVKSQFPPNIPLPNDNQTVDVSNSIDKSTGIGQHSFGPFSERFRGELTLSIDEDDAMITFSTFNVQKLDVQKFNGRVVITCRFAKGSLADGCAVKFNSTLTVNMTKSNHSNTSVHNMTIANGVYNISAYDIVDGERNNFVAFELNEMTFSSALATGIRSYSTESEMSTTTSTQASEVYSTTTASPSNISTATNSPIVTSERSDAEYLLIVLVVAAALALVIVIVLIVGCVMFTIKKNHTKSMEVDVLQESMFIQKPVAQSPVYTELPKPLSVSETTEDQEQQDDPYLQPRSEFLNQSGNSPAPVTSSTKDSDSASLQLACLHETSEQINPGDTPINAYSTSQQSTLFAEYSNPVNATPSQPGSTVSANSHNADIEFTKQRPRPPLKDSKPLVYASVIQPTYNEEGDPQSLQEMPKKETVVAQTGNYVAFCRSGYMGKVFDGGGFKEAEKDFHRFGGIACECIYTVTENEMMEGGNYGISIDNTKVFVSDADPEMGRAAIEEKEEFADESEEMKEGATNTETTCTMRDSMILQIFDFDTQPKNKISAFDEKMIEAVSVKQNVEEETNSNSGWSIRMDLGKHKPKQKEEVSTTEKASFEEKRSSTKERSVCGSDHVKMEDEVVEEWEPRWDWSIQMELLREELSEDGKKGTCTCVAHTCYLSSQSLTGSTVDYSYTHAYSEKSQVEETQELVIGTTSEDFKPPCVFHYVEIPEGYEENIYQTSHEDEAICEDFTVMGHSPTCIPKPFGNPSNCVNVLYDDLVRDLCILLEKIILRLDTMIERIFGCYSDIEMVPTGSENNYSSWEIPQDAISGKFEKVMKYFKDIPQSLALPWCNLFLGHVLYGGGIRCVWNILHLQGVVSDLFG